MISSDKQRVVHFVPSDKIGGLQKFVSDLVAAQKKIGINTEVFSISVGRESAYPDFKKLRFRIFLSLIFSKSPLILHTHGSTVSIVGALGFLHYLKRNLFIIHTVHNEAKYEAGRLRRFLHRIYFKLQFVLPVVIAQSLEKDFENCYKLEPFGYVLNGSSMCRRSRLNTLEADAVRILFLGRLDFQKNIDLLLQAVTYIRGNSCNRYDFKIEVLGRDIDFKNKKMFRDLQEEGVLVYHGELEDPYTIMEKCSVLCLSSRFEGVPIAALEAKLLGLRIISTDVGGMRDICNSADVLVDRNADYEEFGDALLAVIHKEKLNQVSDDEELPDLSIDRAAREYLNIYAKAVSYSYNRERVKKI